MYWFGKTINETSLEWQEESHWRDLRARKSEIFKTDTHAIIDLLNDFGIKFKEPEFCQPILRQLTEQSGFSETEVLNTIKILPQLLSRESLSNRVKAEFGSIDLLNEFTKTAHFAGKVRAVPAGTLLHITAGNVFLSSIDSLIMGFLTKNISILKVSSQNTIFPLFFAQKLLVFDQQKILSDKFAILHWKGGSKDIENFLKSKVNTIIAWGGEEMIQSFRQNLPLSVKLLDFGPKVSIQVVSSLGLYNKNLKLVAKNIIQDITPWDQAACASPQNLYLQEGIDAKAFMAELAQAFAEATPRGNISDDEATEILKEKYRGLYSSLMEGGAISEGKDYLLHLEKDNYLRPSPLNRSVILKTFKDAADLAEHLEPFTYYLQSCSYLLEKSEKSIYLNALAQIGIKRFAPLGTITYGMDGAPHDGRYVLHELVQFIGDEIRAQDLELADSKLSNAMDVKKVFDNSAHPPGYIFSSGGTTGEPKYIHFSKNEFDQISDMLSLNLSLRGVSAGMTVANLFVAGNLWSSFLAIDRALEKIGCIQLPIGGMCETKNIITYLQKFNPQVVLGIPSLLIALAEAMEASDQKINVSHVIYAGESMSESRMNYLKEIWGTTQFSSAGYASVDAGVIGYQCEHCGPGEHHLFSDQVSLKIIDDEAVVTSFYRDSLPIENYRTGDRVSWLPGCECGRRDPRFKLLGRVDNLIQIWSCRILLDDIETSMREMDSQILTYQLVLTDEKKERMTIYYEKSSRELDADQLCLRIYKKSRDLQDTITLSAFMEGVRILSVDTGLIPRNPRTGKVSLIVDKR